MSLSLAWISGLFFIAIRLSVFFLFSPVQAFRQLPTQARIVYIFIFSALLINFVPEKATYDTPALLLGSVAELANGLIMSASLFAAFAVFQIAGQLLENASGLNSACIFDPKEQSQESLYSLLLSLLAGLSFFALNGHLWLFKGLAYSFVIMPPGSLEVFNKFHLILKQFGFAFSMALVIASPILFVLLVIELAAALITRQIPQSNLYFLTLPLKIIISLALTGIILSWMQPISSLVFDRCFTAWEALLS